MPTIYINQKFTILPIDNHSPDLLKEEALKSCRLTIIEKNNNNFGKLSYTKLELFIERPESYCNDKDNKIEIAFNLSEMLRKISAQNGIFYYFIL